MIKKFRAAIIFLVVVLLLIGALIYVSVSGVLDPKDDESAPEEETKTENLVISNYKDELSKISFMVGDIEYEIIKKEENWELVKPKDIKFDSSKINSIGTSLSELEAEKLAVNKAENLADFGLDKPFEVKLEAKDKKETILIGKQTPSESGYYVKKSNDDKIYIVETYTAEAIMVVSGDLLDKELFPATEDLFKTFTFKRAGELVFKAKRVSDTQWSLEEPTKGEMNMETLTPIIETITQTRISEFVEETDDMSMFGFEQPAYEFIVEAKDGTTKVLLGKEKEKDTQIFGMVEGRKDVFVIDQTAFTFLDKPLKELISLFIFIPNYKDVKNLDVRIGDEKMSTKLTVDKDNKDNDVFVVNGVDIKKIDKEKGDKLFREYYQTVVGVTMMELDVESEPELIDPEITIVYDLTIDPGTVKVELVSKDDKFYYGFKDGKYTGYLVAKANINENLKVKTKEVNELINSKE